MDDDFCYEYDLLELSPSDIEICYGLSENIDKVDSNGNTLLLASCKYRNLEYVVFCLERGANPDFLSECGVTPLLEIIDGVNSRNEDDSIPIIEALIEFGANLEIRGFMHKTPFLKACSRGSLEVLELLVKSGCDTKAVVSELGEELDGSWFADCFHLSRELKEYIHSVINVT